MKHPPARQSPTPIKMQAKFFWFAGSSYLINIFGWEDDVERAGEGVPFPIFCLLFCREMSAVFFRVKTFSVRSLKGSHLYENSL